MWRYLLMLRRPFQRIFSAWQRWKKRKWIWRDWWSAWIVLPVFVRIVCASLFRFPLAIMCKQICRNELLFCLTSLASSFSYDNHIMLQIVIILMYYTKDTENIPLFIESGILPIVKSSIYSMADDITREINTRQSVEEVVYPFVSIIHHLSFTSNSAVFSYLVDEGLDYIRSQRSIAFLKELYMRCRGDTAVADECCRILIRLIARSSSVFWE